MLVPLLAVSDHPRSIDFSTLPRPFVVKATHGSGYNLIVREEDRITPDEIVAAAETWLDSDFSNVARERLYEKIPRRIIVEKMLSESGEIPADYKIFVFGGKARLIQVTIDRFDADVTQTSFDEHWRRLNISYYAPPSPKIIEPPPELADLLRTAELLGQDFKFVRVD